MKDQTPNTNETKPLLASSVYNLMRDILDMSPSQRILLSAWLDSISRNERAASVPGRGGPDDL